MQTTSAPKIAVLKQFYLRLGDKQIDMGRDVRVIKDSQRHMVQLVNHKATVTLMRIDNNEDVHKKWDFKPRWVSTWFVVTEEMKKQWKEIQYKPPCHVCGLVMPFEDNNKLCQKCTMVDITDEIRLKTDQSELRFTKKKRHRKTLDRWTVNSPFTVKAFSKELFLEGENVPDLPMFIRRLLA